MESPTDFDDEVELEESAEEAVTAIGGAGVGGSSGVDDIVSAPRKGITPKLVFLVDFLDGYSIRQLLEIVKMTLTSCPFFLTPQGITIQRGNGPKTVVLNTELYQHNLPFYLFNEDLASEPATDDSVACHIICPNIVKLKEAIRSVARKEGIRVYQYEGDRHIYVQVYGGAKNADGTGTIVPLESYEAISYDLIEGYSQSFYYPNCRIPLAEFCGLCTATGRFKSVKKVEFQTYNKGLCVVLRDSTGNAISEKKWGDCDDSHRVAVTIPGGPKIMFRGSAAPKKSYYSTTVDAEAIIKAMAKMTNLVTNGILRVYAERDNLLRLQTMVNYYGPLTLYIRESS